MVALTRSTSHSCASRELITSDLVLKTLFPAQSGLPADADDCVGLSLVLDVLARVKLILVFRPGIKGTVVLHTF